MLGGLIGTSKAELYGISIAIFGLRILTPLCLAYSVFMTVAFFTLSPKTYKLLLIFGVVAYAETLFFLLVYVPRRIYLQREAIHPPPLTREKRRELFIQCNKNILDREAYIRKWFMGAPIEDIRRENVEEFFLWAFFNRDGPPGEDKDELEEYMLLTEEWFGRPFQPGRGDAEALRLTLDKVDMQHRALMFYAAVGFIDLFTFIRLRLSGFHFHRQAFLRSLAIFPPRPAALTSTHVSPARHVTYWLRPHTSSTKLPIVFIHGIGIGLFPYVGMLQELIKSTSSTNADDQVGIIALEILPVSFRITHKALGREQLCTEITSIIHKHLGPTQKFVLVSQSYGTVVTTHMLNDPRLAPQIGPVVLMDPVCILLHLPDVAYNFTRRKPVHANEIMLHYFASMDMGVSHTLSRHFFWSENILWKEDLVGRDVTVLLTGRDLIVDTAAVGRYLMTEATGEESPRSYEERQSDDTHVDVRDNDDDERSKEQLQHELKDANVDEWKYREWRGKGIEVLWFEDLDHGQVIDRPVERKKLVDAISAYSLNA